MMKPPMRTLDPVPTLPRVETFISLRGVKGVQLVDVVDLDEADTGVAPPAPETIAV